MNGYGVHHTLTSDCCFLVIHLLTYINAYIRTHKRICTFINSGHSHVVTLFEYVNWKRPPQSSNAHGNALLHGATRAATRGDTLQSPQMGQTATHTVAIHCNTLQHTVINTHVNSSCPSSTARCNTLQHGATRRNTPQHAATHCNSTHVASTCPHKQLLSVLYAESDYCFILIHVRIHVYILPPRAIAIYSILQSHGAVSL